jgi:beta-xylosidase
MNETMTGFSAFENGDRFLEITPPGYVEAPCMLRHNRRYYFMWSEGSWTDGTYKVAYGVSDYPIGPFKSKGTLLEKQAPIADGPGHHSCLNLDNGEWVIVYHRRIIGEKAPGKRILCIDKLKLSDDGISQVVMTDRW